MTQGKVILSSSMAEAYEVVPAEHLHRCTLCIGSETWRDITLFPFFDRKGRVSCYLLVRPKWGTVYLLDKHATFTWRTPSLVLTSPLPKQGCRPAEVEPFAPLYHYDPWWLLKLTPYDTLPRVEDLLATNCLILFTVDVATVFYDARLKSVPYLMSAAQKPIAFRRKHLRPRLPVVDRKRTPVPPPGWRIEKQWPKWGIAKKGNHGSCWR